ncbi:ATP-binding protein [Dactylosporangium darangshiense]|uniref:Signal transduction histidine kinase n=1 Tax=Dactylosporangium darangshiense TaxID=579108 RepID=A0ABP8D0J6_9ACTN
MTRGGVREAVPGLVGPLWRALLVFRIAALGYAAVLMLNNFHHYAWPAGGWLIVAVMALWTAVSSLAYARPERRGWPLLTADLLVAAGCLLASRWIVNPDGLGVGAPTLPMAWVASPVVAWAISGGRRRGAIAAILLSAADVVVRDGISQATANGPVLMILAGIGVGHIARLAIDAESRMQQAIELEAATRERERLARGIHDSVLQVLALVQRRGTELGGEAAELGRLAGEQESVLRALVTSAPARAASSASDSPARGGIPGWRWPPGRPRHADPPTGSAAPAAGSAAPPARSAGPARSAAPPAGSSVPAAGSARAGGSSGRWLAGRARHAGPLSGVGMRGRSGWRWLAGLAGHAEPVAQRDAAEAGVSGSAGRSAGGAPSPYGPSAPGSPVGASLVAGSPVASAAADASPEADLVDLRSLLDPHASPKAAPPTTPMPKVTIAAPATPVLLPSPVAAEVAAAVAAALDNVARHAGAGAKAWLLLEELDDTVTVTVRDDGRGIPEGRLAEAERAGRLGVAQSIRGRVRDLGGTVTVSSTPGSGTEVELHIPR